MLPCTNMMGTEKQLLFIGRFETPRAFRGRKNRLPVQYKWNKKAWMTRLLKWKIAFVLDKATFHPKELDLSNIDQPLDQGVITSPKAKYRHLYALVHLIPGLQGDTNRRSIFFMPQRLSLKLGTWSHLERSRGVSDPTHEEINEYFSVK